jgi:hypothetical protein
MPKTPKSNISRLGPFKGTSRERCKLFSLLGHYLAITTYAALYQIGKGFQYFEPIFEWKSRKLLAGSWKIFILEKQPYYQTKTIAFSSFYYF